MLFFELIATANRTETKTIITYKSNAQDVMTVNRELLNLAELYNDNSLSGLYAFAVEPEIVEIYKDFEPCYKVTTIYNDAPIEMIQRGFQNYNEQMQDFAGFESIISKTIEAGGYIKNDIMLLLKLRKSALYSQAVKLKRELQKQQQVEDAEQKRKAVERQKQEEAEFKAEIERVKAEKLAFLQGFGAGKTSIQIERLYSVLSKTFTYVYDGKTQRKNRRDFIIDFLSEGYKPERIEAVVRYTGSKWNPRKTKPKTEYRLYGIDKRSYYDITKTEYDFACFYTEKII